MNIDIQWKSKTTKIHKSKHRLNINSIKDYIGVHNNEYLVLISENQDIQD